MDNLNEPRVSRSTAAVVILGSAFITYSVVVGLLYFVAMITGNDPTPGDLTAAAAMVLVAIVAGVVAIDIRDRWSAWVGGAVMVFATYCALTIVGVIG